MRGGGGTFLLPRGSTSPRAPPLRRLLSSMTLSKALDCGFACWCLLAISRSCFRAAAATPADAMLAMTAGEGADAGRAPNSKTEADCLEEDAPEKPPGGVGNGEPVSP